MPTFTLPNCFTTTAIGPTYVIVQRGRTYFENVEELEHVRKSFRKATEIRVEGALAVEVFVNQ